MSDTPKSVIVRQLAVEQHLVVAPGLDEALHAIAALSDNELLDCLLSADNRFRAAAEAGEAVVAQTASFYSTLALVEIERRCVAVC